MSKDSNNLRLLGSPVNLSYRSKKKDDGKNVRNRPRSALQNSGFTPDSQEGYKRPFSADAKDPTSTRNFFKTFSSEVLHSYHNTPVTTIKILPPTTELLENSKAADHSVVKDKELCSNASDYGSEDTFISLGTKIKAKAQLNGSRVKSPGKNVSKYRNIAKRGKKPIDSNTSEEKGSEYNMEIKITERSQSQSPEPGRNGNDRSDRGGLMPYTRPGYDSFFIPLEGGKRVDEDALAGRVSFGSSSIQAEVEHAIDTYSRRLTLTKQQLSLVEEESTQDLDSISHPLSSLSPENSVKDKKSNGNLEGDLTEINTYVVDTDNAFPKAQNFVSDTRTYISFYEDFHTTLDPYQSKNSTAVHTDSSSKDSGYTESGINDDKKYKQNYSLSSSPAVKKSNSRDKIDEPKSLDSISTNIDKGYKTFPPVKNKWAEPLNHSRLLYKDFFLRKEGHNALPPQNSPIQSTVNNILGDSEETQDIKENDEENLDYPSYLLNSSTKAYTSKVIEDYKKELEAINSLHELTIKDIKTDAISPTPLNIDKMFEQHTTTFDDKSDSVKISESRRNSTEETKNKNSLNTSKKDISKVSTKELIQNYFKVKEADYTKDYSTNKNIKKYDRKISNSTTKLDSNSGYKHDWNNKTVRSSSAKTLPVNIKNQTHKNMFTLCAPSSARIEGVQNDKDIDSWMSLSAPSPRVTEIGNTEELEEGIKPNDSETSNSRGEGKNERLKHETEPQPSASTSSEKKEDLKVKELSSNSTVLDIYSMLKEIESFGDMPVTSATNGEVPDAASNDKKEDTAKVQTPRDNFTEIFEFLEKVEQSANDALSVVTTTTPQTIPKLEALLKLPQTELAQRLVTLSLQLEERSCCIALLQESLTNNKQQMMSKVSNLEKQSIRNISKVKQECEETVKRHQNFIDQLINDKKTLNHRIEQLVDERRSLEERWQRSARALEDRYKLQLRNQHDKMAAAQQVARQRWVRQKAEKIKELTVKGLEGELREMAERQQKEVSDIKMYHAEQLGRMQAKHTNELEQLRRSLEEEKEAALVKERQLASSRLEKQILELELSYQEQRTRLIAEMRAENERVASGLSERQKAHKQEIEKWREEQEKILSEKRVQLEQHIAKEKEKLEEQMKQRERELEKQFDQYRKDFEAEQQLALKRKVTEIAAQHKQERDREIERAIESMEAEAQAGRKELQEALRRNKEQYEAELKELGETEQATLRRYQDAQQRIRHTEDKCAEMEVMINQLETRNKILTEKNSSLETELQQARARCDDAWRQTVDNMRRELEDLKKTHEEQMHQLYAKVKVAVARKDSAIKALTREAVKYQEKITTLEQKLHQQRKDFLKHK